MTLTSTDHVVVVGAGLAGWRFIESLRRDGYEGKITLIGDEPYAPYDRPPLSKQVLSGKWEIDKTVLASDEALESANITSIFGVSATSLDVMSHTVTLENGETVSGTHIVIATGTRARRISFSDESLVHTIRNRKDIEGLNALLATVPEGATVAVIGGGFIGAEAATALKARGLTPVVLEALQRPLIGALGDQASQWLLPLASNAEIELRTSQVIRDVSDGSVVFADGSTLEVAAVVLGVGAEVNTEWLQSSGLVLDGGVVVDEHLLASPTIGALGDVAKFPFKGELTRIEHWQVATDHAAALSLHWAKGEKAPDMVPYFWSDQYGKKIQMLGHPHPSDDVVKVAGSDEEGKWLALYSRGGVVTGILSLSQPRWLMVSKVLLDEETTLTRAMELQPWA
jgi:NADPH-dependent 2,4-dienoyl-CoA reductase/sulfur reductase-like enzyme